MWTAASRHALAASRRSVRTLASNTTTDNTSSSFIVHAAGLDRVGIVRDVTKCVLDAGGNVGDSLSGRLGDHTFSLMMLVSNLPNHHAKEALQASIRKLPDLESAVFTVHPGGATPPPVVGYSGDFTLTGADHPGIVHTVTSVMAERYGLSMDRLTTDQEIAPHGGTVLFQMHGTAVRLGQLPFDVNQMKQELEELGDSLNCDLKMVDSVDESVQGSFYAG